MLNKINTIIIGSAFTYKYYDGIADARTNAAFVTEGLVQNILKSRLEVAAFLRYPNENSSAKAIESITLLQKDVLASKELFTMKENIELVDKASNLLSSYLKNLQNISSE